MSPFASFHSDEQHRGLALVKGLVMIATSIVVLVFGVRMGWEVRVLNKSGVVTHGQIVECWGSARGRSSIKISYVFDANGTRETVRGRTSTLEEPLPRGATLRVTYNPRKPSHCLSEHESASTGLALVLIVMGVGLGLAGVWMIVTTLRAGAA